MYPAGIIATMPTPLAPECWPRYRVSHKSTGIDSPAVKGNTRTALSRLFHLVAESLALPGGLSEPVGASSGRISHGAFATVAAVQIFDSGAGAKSSIHTLKMHFRPITKS